MLQKVKIMTGKPIRKLTNSNKHIKFAMHISHLDASSSKFKAVLHISWALSGALEFNFPALNLVPAFMFTIAGYSKEYDNYETKVAQVI